MTRKKGTRGEIERMEGKTCEKCCAKAPKNTTTPSLTRSYRPSSADCNAASWKNEKIKEILKNNSFQVPKVFSYFITGLFLR